MTHKVGEFSSGRLFCQDFAMLHRQYYEAMGWEPETGYPTKSTLKKLDLDTLVCKGR